MELSGDRASQRRGNTASSRPGAHNPAAQATDVTTAVAACPVLSLRPADSPRLNGEDKAHIARLAETETPLPPILVDRRTMQLARQYATMWQDFARELDLLSHAQLPDA